MAAEIESSYAGIVRILHILYCPIQVNDPWIEEKKNVVLADFKDSAMRQKINNVFAEEIPARNVNQSVVLYEKVPYETAPLRGAYIYSPAANNHIDLHVDGIIIPGEPILIQSLAKNIDEILEGTSDIRLVKLGNKFFVTDPQ